MFSKTAKLISTFSVYWASFFFFAIGSWINRTFGQPSFEQILFHLQFGSEGLVNAPRKFILGFIINCALYSFMASACISCSRIIVLRVEKNGYADFKNDTIKSMVSLLFNVSVFIKNKTSPLARKAFFCILFLSSMTFMLTKLSFWDYLKADIHANFIDEHYIPPTSIISPAEKRNLVLLYAESLETAYSDEALFGRNLLTDIDSSTNDWESFADFSQTFGTEWTMGGIVSSQCGIPLRPFAKFDKDILWGEMFGNLIGEKADRFLPRVTCLGDVLEKAGYTSVFLGGADEKFAGKGKFFRQHGYEEVVGKTNWKESGENVLDGWGLHDDRLFRQAQLKLDELQASGQPFNLTILTVDMHHPYGYINETCQTEGVE